MKIKKIEWYICLKIKDKAVKMVKIVSRIAHAHHLLNVVMCQAKIVNVKTTYFV